MMSTLNSVATLSLTAPDLARPLLASFQGYMSRSSLRWPTDKRPLLVKHLAVSLCALVSANLAWVTGVVAATPAGALPSAHLGERTPASERKILQGGWYPWDPYQYREARHGVQILTGFDVEIERAVARAMGVDLILTDIPWDQHLAGLAAGTVDIAAGATYSPERDRYAYFSKPYRHETDVLILQKGAGLRYPFQTIEQMLDLFTKHHFRLGVITGYVYANKRVNEFIADPVNRDLIFRVPDDRQNLKNLFGGTIGGVVRDLLLNRDPLGIVRDPLILLTILGTVLAGMLVIKIMSLAGGKRFAQSLESRGHLGTHLIKAFDALGLAAFLVIGVVAVLDTSAQPLWLWGAISAGITTSFGGLLRDLFRHDHLIPSLRGELFPEIAVIWGLALSLFLQWKADRLEPEEILLGVIITIVGAFFTRMLAIVYRLKGWSYV